MVLKKYEKLHIDEIIIGLIAIVLVIDSINGIFIRIGLPSISQLYKIFLLGLMAVRIVKYSIKDFIVCCSVLLLLILPTIVGFYKEGGHLEILKIDIAIIFKYILLIFSYFFFSNLIKKNSNFLIGDILFVMNASFIVIALNMILGILGFGFAQYGEGSDEISIGTKGFFYAGNEITGVMIVVFVFILFQTYKNKKLSFYILTALVLLLLSLMKATKGAILGTILSIISVPFLYYCPKLLRVSFTTLKRTLLMVISLVLLAIVVYQGIFITGLSVRLKYFFLRKGIVSFILSSRDVALKKSLQEFIENSSLFEILFGKGTYLFTRAVVDNYGQPIIVEIDLFDFLFQFGFIGVTIVYGFHLYWLFRSIYFWKTGHKTYVRFIFLMNTLMLFISLSAGHIFNSGMVTLFLGMLNSLFFYHNKSLNFE